MSYEAVARRYAQAVFELGKESGKLDELSTQLTDVAKALDEHQNLRDVLTNPLLDHAAQEAILVDVATRLGASKTACDTLRVLVHNRRVVVLPEMARALGRLVDKDAKTLVATVTAAVAPSEAYLTKLKAELEKTTGQKIRLTVRTDPSLIAGVVVQIGDRVIDGSVKAKLSRFREGLAQTS